MIRTTSLIITSVDLRYRKLIAIAGFMLLLAGLPGRALAQDPKDWEKDGGIPNAEIEIVKDRKITLPPADRNFEKIQPRPAEPIRHDITYDYKNLKFNTSDYSPQIRPLKLKAEEIPKIYGNYVSGGFGNYTSPYLEAYFNSRRDKNRFYGLHFYHHSFGSGPVDGRNSASGTSEISLFGKSITNAVTASGQLNFENRNMFFYGYRPGTEPKRDDIRQSYNILSLSGALENSKPGDLNYKLQAGYSYLDDHFKTSEGETGLNFSSTYAIAEKSTVILNADYYLITRKDSMASHKARNLFKVRPAYQFNPMEELVLTAGLNIAAENDITAKVHIYPNLRADYKLAEAVTLYAALTGDMDKVTLHSLSRENNWVGTNLTIYHTDRVADFQGGFKGKLGSKIAFNTGLSLATLHNLYSFRNIRLLDFAQDYRSRFDITYNKTSRVNIFGELGFSPGENVKMSVRGDVFSYTTEAIYHRPKYRLAYTSSYNLFDKLWFNVDLIAQGGMKAFDPDKNTIVTLPSAFDLNAKADYFFSRRVSAFVKANNLLSNKYQLYLYYPVRGLQVMAGVTCTF